jgi:catechol 2,3-dioxygenase-like lactoylglutathione lyase family enzyme
VGDLGGARSFYEGVLGLTLVSEVAGRHLFFRLGAGMLLLFKPEASSQAGDLPGHGATGPGHLCFKVGEADLDAWRMYLQARGVVISAEQAWPKGGRSLYFEDPAGNVLELAPARIWR